MGSAEDNVHTSAPGAESHGTEAEGGEGHHETHDVYAVLLPWFVQSLGVVVFFILTRRLHGLPYTAVLFVLGLFMGLGASRSDQNDQLTQSIRLWTEIDYHVLFAVFLPGLLFKDALETNVHLFNASISQLLCLAFPLVLAGTMLTGLVAQYILPYGWSFYQSLTLGCILAATDPVAVSALLNEVGAPPRLKVHISGESLLNDGSAVVFFYVFGGLFLYELGIDGLGGNLSVGEAFAIFFRMSLGGASVGLAFAIALVFILYKLDRRMEREEIVLQVASTVTIAYLSFYTSETVCKMSGVIAVVVCGIVTKAFGGGMISDWQVMDSFWGLLEHLLNTVIFALGGIVFGEILGRKDIEGIEWWNGRDWGYLIVLYLLVNIIRFFLMFSFFPVNKRIGLGTNWKEVCFSSWGGLRGAVGITLALALDNAVFAATDDPHKQVLTTKLFGMVGGIALLTLVINGSSSGPVLERLGLADTSESRKRIVIQCEEATRRRILDDFIHLMTDERFSTVDFALVRHHCPLLKDVTAEDLKTALEVNKESVHPNLYKSPNLQHVLPYFEDAAGLRISLAKTRMDFFSSGVGGPMPVGMLRMEQGLETVAEDIPDNEASLAAAAELIKDTRIMFVELLRAAYTTQIKDGELDPREYDGFLVYALFQGLDFAQDAVSNGKPLCDWSSMQIGSTKIVYKAEHYANRFLTCCCAKKESPKERLEVLKDKEPFRYQQLRLDALRSLSFIDAHKEAQERLQEEFSDGTGDASVAFHTVMNESRAEVRKAREALVSKNKKKLKHVISHYLCTILQNKAARYVNVLAESGVLLQREVRHFLEEIEHHIRQIRKCPLDTHPGSMDFADETEVQDWRRSRRRIKAQSFL